MQLCKLGPLLDLVKVPVYVSALEPQRRFYIMLAGRAGIVAIKLGRIAWNKMLRQDPGIINGLGRVSSGVGRV